MNIRTKLLLAFLALAVVPMAVIVLFGYVSSERAVRQAVAKEASLMTADMSSRLAEVRNEMQERVERVGSLPFITLANEEAQLESDAEQSRQMFFGALVGELGESADLLERLEFVPEEDPAAPSRPENAGGSNVVRSTPASPPTVVIEMTEVMRQVEETLDGMASEAHRQEAQRRAEEGIAAAAAAAAMLGRDFHGGDEKSAEAWRITFRERVDDGLGEDLVVPDEPSVVTGEPGGGGDRGAIFLDASPDLESFRASFGDEFAIPVREQGEVVGQLRARVKSEHLLRRILGRTRRTQGEVPFALNAEGELFTLDEEDRSRLERLPILDAVTSRESLEEWVVVTTDVPSTEMSFGIARPISNSLAEIRKTALRNFGFGIGLIGLAMLGVVPVTRRLSANVRELTTAAERIAKGDLSIRIPVRSQDEIGQLAVAFNTMTGDLSAHQERLIEQERSRRDSEVERQLLEAEIERQTAELEDARRFQLSLLPKRLPRHANFELAVEMRTATEVGGDYYDFQLSGEGVLTAAVGDATGHGARAGTMVTVIKSLFSAHPPGESLAEFLGEAGRAIRRMELGRMAMALALARLQKGRLTVTAAGMPPALLFRGASARLEEIACAGMPLGSFDAEYRQIEIDVTGGDTLLLMTDGLPELPNATGEPFGYDRCQETFSKCGLESPEGIVNAFVEAASNWTDREAPADDVTLVVLRIR
jgi:serine phosphatase RsbU (regulator of sigma subunit)